ncbi:squalene-hopene/tetraprenyl-beta-curcumene cyclase [Neorhodopirellula lusitana]|uniref:Squalene-hopene/tetraprenyl-beta-curcumene cyclase n=1 Tax=Neorhodopirellula lusitana TaxID=445327 RepID=A0ABY1PT24_9BACT|nr:prenyltransferase/squalene oxidase repeat-containing protein [Neorhodopirellula lusitana]SMP46086.1 squalene-hopene/tetraprenyl-beta-curcumene cyclase [Neorhodopirellula lusitana]
MTDAPLRIDTRKPFSSTLNQLDRELLSARNPDHHWTGQLSASALSTATAISALCVAYRETNDTDKKLLYSKQVQCGIAWMLAQANPDGGFGDTDRSHSNIATSYLVLAAITLSQSVGVTNDTKSRLVHEGQSLPQVMDSLQNYLEKAGGIPALRKRYGTDKTFVVPILTNLAIAGCVSWDEVAALPFEAAVFPQSMYRFLGMPVVSYAVPALVAIGQVKFHKSGCLPPWSWVRQRCIAPTLNALQRMQPDSGGYLEATPLTAFVAMSLIEKGLIEHPVVQRGLDFLLESATADHSWPIDTNLATWVTSLSIAALSSSPGRLARIPETEIDELTSWILSCQHNERHPFTGADPGGWGWTDLSGAVPDADDTPGAMIALTALRSRATAAKQVQIDDACQRGANWLLKLQNRDGGWPTFCRGWGKLPFDRSSVDLTAHAIRAFNAMPTEFSSQPDVQRSIDRGVVFLRKQQNEDGSWAPLWFGNQDRPDEDNPIYGTAKVLVDCDARLGEKAIFGGLEYLIANTNPDGGWGGGQSVLRYFCSDSVLNADAAPEGPRTSTVEETALAVECFTSLYSRMCAVSGGRNDFLDAPKSLTNRTRDAILGGTAWLNEAIADKRHEAAWPIGFYFAKLWYYEKLYPTIFATAALGRVDALNRVLAAQEDEANSS